MADDPVVVHVHKHEAEPVSVTQHTCLKHTGLAPKRFLDLCARGELPHKRAGHDRVVLLEDVKAWLRSTPVVKVKPPTPEQLDEAELVRRSGGRPAA